ncbi:MAG TPA: YdcF family protein [Bryobacteraceae bacterium]|nr:YdcF family protein [Bryobacteraceae bacterium]
MFRNLKNLLASVGALLAVVTFVPPTWYAQWLASPWTDAQAPILIVLGGDSVREGMMAVTSYWRWVYTVDVYREGGIRRIVLSGDAPTTASMRAWLIGQGIPSDVIAVEHRSHSTRENVLFTSELLRDAPGPFLLLSSDIHTWRARRTFLKAGLKRPSPSCARCLQTR